MTSEISGAQFTLKLKRVIELTGGHIGLSSYPIFDAEYRTPLNEKIKQHFWNREIGLETISLFKFNLARHMNEIMPYFNQLYETTRLQFDPLSTMSIKSVTTSDTSQTTSSDGESSTTTNADGSTRSVVSETPQQMLARNKDYATSGSDVKSTNIGESVAAENSEQSTEAEAKTESETTGYQGPVSELLMAYRATLLNLDMDIINSIEAAGLFMLVWDTGDSYTNSDNYYYSGRYYI